MRAEVVGCTSAKCLFALGAARHAAPVRELYCTRSESAREARGVGQRGNHALERREVWEHSVMRRGRRVWGVVGSFRGFLRGFLPKARSTSRALRGPREAKPVRGVLRAL